MANGSYSVTYYREPGGSPIRFSQVELQQLFLSWGVLTVAFAVLYNGGFSSGDWSGFPLWLALAAAAVFTAFVCHELAHKFVAQRYGCWAEFRYWPFGLLMALLFSFMGFLFAAPGAVMISGRITERENGIISLAGPASNFVMAGAFGVIGLIFPNLLIASILSFIGFVNALIGAFNLIPIPPFDGSKILRWSLGVYIGAVVLACVLLFGVYNWMGLF